MLTLFTHIDSHINKTVLVIEQTDIKTKRPVDGGISSLEYNGEIIDTLAPDIIAGDLLVDINGVITYEKQAHIKGTH